MLWLKFTWHLLNKTGLGAALLGSAAGLAVVLWPKYLLPVLKVALVLVVVLAIAVGLHVEWCAFKRKQGLK